MTPDDTEFERGKTERSDGDDATDGQSRYRSGGALGRVTERLRTRRTFMNRTAVLGGGALALATGGASASGDPDEAGGENGENGEDEPEGYRDEKLPEPYDEWYVHDPDRPAPPEVDPGVPCLKDIPDDAEVLFDGSDTGLDRWETPDGGEPEWNLVEAGGAYNRHAPPERALDRVIEVEPETGPIRTTDEMCDAQFYIEYMIPEDLEGEGQGRGNSGVFLMEHGEYGGDGYEIQVLDSHDNPTYADGSNAAIYGQYPPLFNASRPQGEWQTYNILWKAPRFEDDELQEPAHLTLIHNGIAVHNNRELMGAVAHRETAEYHPHPLHRPLQLQDHGDRVRFGRMWYREVDWDPDDR